MAPIRNGGSARDRSQSVGRFYEAEATCHDSIRWASREGEWTDKVQKEIVRSMLEDSKTKTVLELAIGTGRIGIDLARDGWQIVGVDMAYNMLRIARDKARKVVTCKVFDLIQASAVEIPVTSKSFDVCIAVNSLSLMPQHEVVIREVARVLKPGGVFVCNFANILSYYMLFGLIANCRKRALARDVYIRWHMASALRRQFERAGFEVGDVQGHMYLPSYMHFRSLLPLVKAIDKVSRNSSLRYLCPSLFFKLVRL